VSITIDTNHDYYITFYLTSANTSSVPYTSFSPIPPQWASCFGYISGDHTNDADASGLQSPSTGNLNLFAQVTIG